MKVKSLNELVLMLIFNSFSPLKYQYNSKTSIDRLSYLILAMHDLQSVSRIQINKAR